MEPKNNERVSINFFIYSRYNHNMAIVRQNLISSIVSMNTEYVAYYVLLLLEILLGYEENLWQKK